MAGSASRAPSRPSPAASSVLQIAASPAPAPGGRGPTRRHPASQLDLRVSDAERAEVADQLAHHFGAGRLDDNELSERLDRVMGATTYRDLGGVLQDLPGSVVPSVPAPPVRPAKKPRRRRGGGLLKLALIALLVIVAAAAAHAVVWALAPVLWIGVLCAIAVLAARARSRR